MSYDSKADTLEHIQKVNANILQVCQVLIGEAITHDKSKLEPKEKDAFDKLTPLLKDTTYGSDEYHKLRKELGEALEHHYKSNPHHPEHYGEYGINGMNFVQGIVMLCDWKAASERHADGDLRESLKINSDRFQIEPQLQIWIENTAESLGWLG